MREYQYACFIVTLTDTAFSLLNGQFTEFVVEESEM